MLEDNLWEKPPIDELMHYGMPRRSGRFPWGSGKDNYQHGSIDWYGRVQKMRESGFTFTDENGKTWTGDNAIAKSMGLSSTQFRTAYAIAKDERRSLQVATARRLRDKEGMNPTEIGRKMGINESSVRSLLNAESEVRMNQAKETADYLRKQIETKGVIDIGKGVEHQLGITRNKLDEAITMLEFEGYQVWGGGVKQINSPGQQTVLQVIGPKDMPKSAPYDYKNIHSLTDYHVENDGNGDKFYKLEYPSSMDSKRLAIRYKEDGGITKDGTMEIRPGCKDLDLQGSNYAQVRILVDGDHYLKGVALYGDPKDFPKGVDVIFNTNKDKSKSKMEVLKEVKPENKDSLNPFGSLIKEKGGQYHYVDDDGKTKLGLINKRSDEGDWDEWSNKLPSQFLAKQNMDLIKRQIKITKDEKTAEYNKICELTNPTVKKKLLQEFADGCDGAAADLKLASLPRQRYKVILPVDGLKDTECYAPTYNDGEKLALVRYPHGGTFEIPIVTVNNKHAAAKKKLGNAPDGIGINSKVAEILSGADFDGDTVVCIPTAGNGKNLGVKITSTVKQTSQGIVGLKGLKDFDPKDTYGASKVTTDSSGKKHYYNGDKEYSIMKKTNTEMGIVSNLITDMTIRRATDDEVARAVRHSMVVIDAAKHKLDYKQSYVDNGIGELKKKYQKHYDAEGNYKEGGASTLFSQAGSEVDIGKRKGSPKIDSNTGKLVYKEAHETYVDKNGVTKERTQKVKKMSLYDDANVLSSGTPKEKEYANYANYMKALANSARKEILSTKDTQYSKEAKAQYEGEVKSLNTKLRIAEANKPKERMAQIKANAALKERKKAYEDTDLSPDEVKKELKKIGQQELSKARAEYGARKEKIEITDNEWNAIQAGAISPSKLKSILDNADIDVVRQKAMPKETKTIKQSQITKMKNYANNGYTIAEIAKAMGVSTSTVTQYLS